MDERRIRLNKTNSNVSVNRKTFTDIHVTRHTKPYHFPSVSETIDQRRVFEEEREKSSKYRLILTINPFCSNILFNAVTEIVQNEGSDDAVLVGYNSSLNLQGVSGLYGKDTSVNSVDMIRNTEYSNDVEGLGFVYHCGYDIFNNHILRNQTFKMVNPLLPSSTKRNVYNTINDYMRYSDGSDVYLATRTNIKNIVDPKKKKKRHLYIKDDILSITDAINANISEENGWFGFNNRSSIPSCKYNSTKNKWEDLKISKVFNGEHSSCEFVEMYPDSTLFSFNPKYNEFKNREEQNWDLCITYPYENDMGYHTERENNKDKLVVDKILTHTVMDGGILNALLLADFEQTIGTSGQNIIMFRSYVKHNLKPGDKLKLFYIQNDNYEAVYVYQKMVYTNQLATITQEQYDLLSETEKQGWTRKLSRIINGNNSFNEIKDVIFEVTNVGDLKSDNLDYYFYINNVDDILTQFSDLREYFYEKGGERISVTYYNTLTDEEKQGWVLTERTIDTLVGNKNFTFRFIKVVNDMDCKYYYRKFKKLPNFKFKKQELTDEVANDKTSFEQYVTENACERTLMYESTPAPGVVAYITPEVYNAMSESEKERWYPVSIVKEPRKLLEFAKEQYPLAFSRTIYNDKITQATFTDTIDIDKITDNLGRPLTEFYITVIKKNSGHDIWYKSDKLSGIDTTGMTDEEREDKLKEICDKIEYSHCFGKVRSGLEIHAEKTDDVVENGIKVGRMNVGDASLLTNCDEIDNTDGLVYSATPLDDDITIDADNDMFYGDVVELDCHSLLETVLSDVYFRFNTEQREHVFPAKNNNSEIKCGTFIYDEFISDDYDKDGWKCQATDADFHLPETFDGSVQEEVRVQHTTYRPEGYMYKAHYPVKVREFGSLRQASNREIKVRTCNPKQGGGLFIEVVSTLRSGVNTGSVVYLCNEDETLMIPLTVYSVQSNVRFLLNPMQREDSNYMSVYEIVDGLCHSNAKTITQEDVDEYYHWVDKDGSEHTANNDDIGKTVYDYGNPKYKLKLKNVDIPDYAYKVGVNLYLWRDVLHVGNKDVKDLPEYPFANDHFYVNKTINFFLKRQDPFGYNGLLNEELWPNDIYGNVKKTDNYEYKDETNVVC